MDISNYILEVVKSIKAESPILVAFDGVDTAGKSFLADKIFRLMTVNKILSPVRISIDQFHNPKHIRLQKGELSPEGFFLDSFNYEAIFNCIINPIKSFDRFLITGIYDYKSETSIQSNKIPISNDTVVLFDGIFMNRDELYKHWDLSIFLDVTFETAIDRAKSRDLCLFGSIEMVINKYNNRYIPGEMLYLNNCKPKDRAHIVVDNNDYNKPILTKMFRNRAYISIGLGGLFLIAGIIFLAIGIYVYTKYYKAEKVSMFIDSENNETQLGFNIKL